MNFLDVFMALVILNVNNSSVNSNDTQVKYFINREIYEEVQRKDEDLKRKKDREGKQKKFCKSLLSLIHNIFDRKLNFGQIVFV